MANDVRNVAVYKALISGVSTLCLLAVAAVVGFVSGYVVYVVLMYLNISTQAIIAIGTGVYTFHRFVMSRLFDKLKEKLPL